MKKLKTTIYLLMLLSVVITAIMLQFMPDIVPAHYNAAGEIDRLGSKYEFFLFPAATVIMGAFFLMMEKFVLACGSEKDRKSGSAALGICGVIIESWFIVMEVYAAGKAIAYGGGSTVSMPAFDLAQIDSVFAILQGALLVILGNYMPKARVNAFFGLRTKWSMANDRFWQKSQRFGGFLSVLCGCVLILLGIIAKTHLLLWMLLILLLWGGICIAASYHYYRKDRKAID